jgi:hypothetical protein
MKQNKIQSRLSKSIFVALAMIVLAFCVSAVAVSAELDNLASISVSLVNQDPDPATAGNIAELRLGVQNVGGKDAEDMIIEFIPEYPFTLVSESDAVQDVGAVLGYQGYYESDSMKIIKYKVRVDKDAIAGSYDFKVRYYEKGSSNTAETSLVVDVSSSDNAEIIHIDKTVLVPGQQSSIKFKINNVGNSPLRELTFSWENDDGAILPVGSDNTRYIKYIDVGDSAEIEYQVIADTNADAGLYKLDLYLSYQNSGNSSSRQISTIAGVYVGGGTDFDVTYSESSGSDVSFTIANIGSNPATSVSVIVPQQSGWQVSGASSSIIGNLDSGDYTIATFTLQSTQSQSQTGFVPGQQGNFTRGTGNAGSSSPQMNNTRSSQLQSTLKLQIAYTDTMGTRQTVDKQVSMSQSSSGNSTASSFAGTGTSGMPYGYRRQQQSFFSKYKWYLVGLLALVIVGGVLIKYRKGKLLDPNYRLKDVFRGKDKTASQKKK